ncbi:MAG: preprotein translocase subunit SecY [Clostridiales bacterium]|jgi:preprotein translocase subunit SecY|nr:preprotein translocase subunit SecY [Clostridiales bacterium]PWM36503.1 MAG: preprotein translocase subunit SecY [Oscillospiraceae bacterium]
MFQTLKNAWKIPELKNKLLFTLLIIVLYRLGSAIPLPWVNSDTLQSWFSSQGGNALGWLNVLSGGALSRATLFALSVSPYITASIVVQLLTIAIPKFTDWSKEGESGQKKLSLVTRWLTVVLALVTAVGYTLYISNSGMVQTYKNTWENVVVKIVLVACYCAGAALIMWLAERINEFGIGNGISIILFANIISRLPAMAESLWKRCFTSDVVVANSTYKSVGLGAKLSGAPLYIVGSLLFLLFIGILLFFTVLVVWFSNSERRIPVQYAKRVVGRKMYGGQSSTLPIKLDMSGVMPIIFASSIVSIPSTIAGFGGTRAWATWINDFLGYTSFPYIAIYLILIVAFAYFYIMISFNPVEVANNLQQNGGAVPGIRPGRPTVAYITKILNRITLLGALFLIVLSGVPMIVNAVWYSIDGYGLSELAFSGSSLLIVVGVALETFRELEAQMTLRNYKGFLD